jgi:hypothetical protein
VAPRWVPGEPTNVGPMSHLGDSGLPDGQVTARRLSGRETAFWYGLAGVTYVGVSIFHKFLLNWFVGPLWLVAVVWLGPLFVDAVRRRGTGSRGAVE